MRCRVFNWFTLFSLLLCLGAIAAWIRGRQTFDRVTLDTPYTQTSLIAGGGKLRLIRLGLDFGQPELRTKADRGVPPTPGWHWTREVGDADDLPETLIFQTDVWPRWPRWLGWLGGVLDEGHPPIWNRETPPFADGWQLTIPDWSVVQVTLVLPVVLAVRWWRGRVRRRQGICRTCGYDLRASKETCPECGEPVPVVSPASK